MIVKTITCHDVYNVGAGLQAYALSEYLRELGNNVEIIDYKPDYLSNHFPLWGHVNPVFDKPIVRELYCFAKLPGRIKQYKSRRKKEFDSFKKDYLKCTQRYSSFDELKNNPPKADIIFAGSDQIWNTFFQNGKDASFYLDFVPQGTIRAAYAGSFATDELAPEWKNQVKEWLSKMDYISVRESSGLNILNDIGITNATQVLDPVFLLDKSHWETICENLDLNEKYLLFYDFDNSEQAGKKAKKIAKEKGLKIYSLLQNPYADRCFENYGPRAFVTLVKNAEFVFSNSFHATAFSLIFEKQFTVFNRNEKINTRMRDIVTIMGIENHLITNDFNAKINNIDYSIVSKIRDKNIKLSKAYLDKVLSGE